MGDAHRAGNPIEKFNNSQKMLSNPMMRNILNQFQINTKSNIYNLISHSCNNALESHIS